MAENECPNFSGLFTAKVIKSHVKLHVKSDAQKVNSLGLMDFAFGLVNSVLNLHDEQVMFFEEFKLNRNCEINSARQKSSWG